MPQPSPTVQERRFAALCRLQAVLYLAASLSTVLSAGTAPAALPGTVLAVAMMTAVATACLIAAARPRERRHAMLPAAVSQLTAFVLAAAYLLAGHSGATLTAVAAINLPLFALSAWAWRSAAPGVTAAPAHEAPPPQAEESPKIQLKVSKS